MSKLLQCVDGRKPSVKRTFIFEKETYVWLLCDECKDKASFRYYDKEETCE